MIPTSISAARRLLTRRSYPRPAAADSHTSMSAARVLTAALVFGTTVPAAAQLASPSATALGMAENYTAVARGFSATAWNPAALGMPGNPGASFALFPVTVVAGLGPIGPADISEWQGTMLPDAVKDDWYQRIVAAGGEKGSAGADLTLLAFQVGRFGAQLSTTARVLGSVGPGAAAVILYGNAGRTGEAEDFSLDGSAIDFAAASTAAISYGHPVIRERDRSAALGVTLKRTVGHALFSGRDMGSQLDSDPLQVRIDFPIIHSDTTGDLASLNSGRGVSLDLSGAWQQGALQIAIVARNVVNTFAWDEETLLYRPGVAIADSDDTTSDFDTRPFSAAPAAVQERIEELGFSPVLSLGTAYQAHSKMVVSADLRRRLGDSVLTGPRSHLGAGVEVLPVNWLPIRMGAAAVTGGHLLSAGIGLRLGPVLLASSAALTSSEYGNGSMVMFGLSGGEF